LFLEVFEIRPCRQFAWRHAHSFFSARCPLRRAEESDCCFEPKRKVG
jgi:hypothetical protein